MNKVCFKKFTLVELLCVIAIIGILASILLPKIGAAREKTIRAVCANNQSQLYKAYYTYSSQNSHFLVSAETRNARGHAPAWFRDSRWRFDTHVLNSPIWPYIENKAVFRCPSEPRAARKNGNYKRSYSINVHLNGRGWVSNRVLNVSEVLTTSNTYVFLDDADPRGRNLGSFVAGWHSRWVDWPGSNHGKKTIPLSFFDGHTENYTYKEKTTSEIKWFWSRAGYEDRKAFMDMAHPLR